MGILDTGIDYNHPDLKKNIWVNEKEANGIPGVDDDNNGYIDDIHGINPAYGTSDPMDDQGHGTHVAGVIGAVGYNEKGIAGINWHIKMIACKFLDDKGSGWLSDEIECTNYIKALKKRGVNIVATNNSYGGYYGANQLNLLKKTNFLILFE